MPIFERGDVRINYEVHGEGFPVLLFAPGGLRSAIPLWYQSPWNPIEVLAGDFQVVAMDQRNAGQSSGPIQDGDGWHTYTEDHLALLDHLSIDTCHLVGGCIGGPYCFGVIEAAPERVASAVIQQSIGSDGQNATLFAGLFDNWANDQRPLHPNVTDEQWAAFKHRMFGGDFVYNVSRDFMRQCPTPLLVLMGSDMFHPEVTSREIAELAPHATLVERWQEPDVIAGTEQTVLEFLKAHVT